MARDRSNTPFRDDWRKLLKANGWTQKEVAIGAGVEPSFFSKALREKSYKRLSPDLVERISVWAGLPADYYPEVREARVLEAVRADPKLRDRLFDDLG